MKRIITLVYLFSLVVLVSAQPSVRRFVSNPALKHASIGICVKDLNTGRNIISYNAEKALTPASTMKLVTTATALELLGDDYRYETIIGLDAERPTHIIVQGSGDPTLGSEVLEENPDAFLSEWASRLISRCATKNVWHVYVADEFFGYEGISPEWTWIDMGNYYAAGAYGISIFDNTYRIYFDTTDRATCPKILRTEPKINSLSFTNYLTLNNSGRDNGYIYGMPFSYERTIRGNIPAGRKSFSIKGDIPDPGLLLAELFADALRAEGINVQSYQTTRAEYIAGICGRSKPRYHIGEVLHTHQSPPMRDIIREINVKSNNHYAEHLLRTIGRKADNDMFSDPLKSAVNYVHRFWKSKNIDATALNMEDGCGLAPQDAVSPAFLTDLLQYMHTDSQYSNVFYGSLPKVGEEGTLRYFMRKTKYQGKIRAKSGSIGGVQCYAGYLVDGNKKYAFSIMINKFNGTRAQVRKAIEQFLLSL